MKNISTKLHEDLKNYYDAVSNMVGLTEVPLNSSELIQRETLKKEKELTVLVKEGLFNHINNILNVEDDYFRFINGDISEKDFENILNSPKYNSYEDFTILNIENSDLKIHLEASICDDEQFGLIGILCIKLFKDDVCLLKLTPVTNSTLLKYGVPFSFNNYYYSGFLTNEGEEFLNNLNHGYRIKFSII